MKFTSEPHNETEVDRKIFVGNEEVRIESQLKQTVDPKTFMKMFREKVNRHRELTRKVRDMENSITELLNEHEEKMHNAQVIDEDEEKDEPVGDLVSNLSAEDMNKYAKMKKGKEQIENKRKELQDVEEDFLELEEGAYEVAGKFDDIEMPNNYELVKEEIEED